MNMFERAFRDTIVVCHPNTWTTYQKGYTIAHIFSEDWYYALTCVDDELNLERFSGVDNVYFKPAEDRWHIKFEISYTSLGKWMLSSKKPIISGTFKECYEKLIKENEDYETYVIKRRS